MSFVIIEITLWAFIFSTIYGLYFVFKQEILNDLPKDIRIEYSKELLKGFFKSFINTYIPMYITLCNLAVYGLMQEKIYLYLFIFWLITSGLYYVLINTVFKKYL